MVFNGQGTSAHVQRDKGIFVERYTFLPYCSESCNEQGYDNITVCLDEFPGNSASPERRWEQVVREGVSLSINTSSLFDVSESGVKVEEADEADASGLRTFNSVVFFVLDWIRLWRSAYHIRIPTVPLTRPQNFWNDIPMHILPLKNI